jgi:hypothetical protein
LARLHSLTSITVDRHSATTTITIFQRIGTSRATTLIPTADNSAARTTGFKTGWSSMKSATGGLNVALFT